MKLIGEILVESGVFEVSKYEEAKEEHGLKSDVSIGDILIEKGYLDYDSIIHYLNSEINKHR